MSAPQPPIFLEDIQVNNESGSFDAAKLRNAAEHVKADAPKSSQREKRVHPRPTIDAFFTPSGVKRIKTASGSGVPSSLSSTPPKALAKPRLNSIPFSLSAYKSSLNDEEGALLQLECETMGLSWLKLLKDEIKRPYFLDLKRFLWKAGLKSSQDIPPTINIFPQAKDIYSWSKTPLGKVKVVIIGQDPYHGAGQAHGLCFSVPVGIKIPPSLLNIYKELKTEFPDFTPPRHGNLVAWANSGVLMLNTCLTVKANEANSHSRKGWEQFTGKVIEVVDHYGGANLPRGPDSSEATGVGRGIVFLAWGAWASERVAKLDKSKHLILTSAHPSPYSADRGFFGNGHFLKANAWLEERYGVDGKVDWCSLQLPDISPE